MPQREKRTLEIEARANDFVSRPFRTMANRAAALAKRWGSAFKKMAKAVTSVRGIVTGFIAFLAVRRAFGFIKGIADDLDFVVKTADRLQATTESLSALTFVAELAGVEFRSFAQGLAIFSKNLENARRGSKLQAEAFQRLGIDIENLPLGPGGKVDLIELLAQASEGMNQLGQGTQKVDAVLNAFGRQGSQLGPLLEQGAAAIRAQAAEAERLGLVLDRGTLARAAEFNDALTRLSASFRGLFQDVFIALAPKASALITELATAVGSSRKTIVESLTAIGKAFVSLFQLVAEGVIEFVKSLEKITGPLVNLERLEKRLRSLRKELRELPTVFSMVQRQRQESGLTGLEATRRFSVGRLLQEESPLGEEARRLSQTRQRLQEEIRGLEVGVSDGLGAMIERAFTAVTSRIRAFEVRVTSGGGTQGPPVAPGFGSRGGGGPTTLPRNFRQGFLDPGLQGPKTQLQQVVEIMDELERKRQTFFSRFGRGMDDAIQGWIDFGRTAQQSGEQLVNSGLNIVASGLASIIARTQSTKEAFRRMAQGIVQELGRIISKLIIVRLLSSATGLFGGGGGGSEGAGGGGGGGGGFTPGSGTTATSSRIIPSLGGGGVTIVYSPRVESLEGDRAAEVLVREKETIAGLVGNAINRRRLMVARIRDA